MKALNLFTYFSQRELDFCPQHFVKTNATLTDEAYQWVLERLQGRYYLSESLFDYRNIYFEDSSEAVLYELTWSS